MLHLDPRDPAASVQVETAADPLLGPALRVRGHIRARAPMFAAPAGNAALLPRKDVDILLHPFANQGAVWGNYAVFLDYQG